MQSKRLKLTHVLCPVCGADDNEPVGVGFDYEYRTSRDVFLAVRCAVCALVYLNPRPDVSEFETIYPSEYHAFDFSEKDYGLVHKIRSRLEAKRLLGWCAGLPADARILDVGCGDGFHLKLLGEHGAKSWTLEGVDFDERAVRQAEKSGLKVHRGSVENLDLPADSYDLAIMIQTVEHLESPLGMLHAVKRILKSGGKLVVVTDNTDSLDFKFFKGAYWGGYHFPRHWSLFNRQSLTHLATRAGFDVFDLKTQVSPVNWVYSIHNLLVDREAPPFLINRFTLKSAVSLSAFTSLDILLQKLGRGALLRAILQKPQEINSL
jgi:SAM-dependent methyltransferase